LLAIVTIPRFFVRSFFTAVKISGRIEKKLQPLLRCPLVQQIIEIPRDIAIDRGYGARRTQRIINLNN